MLVSAAISQLPHGLLVQPAPCLRLRRELLVPAPCNHKHESERRERRGVNLASGEVCVRLLSSTDLH
jgi:hypothetical protein